MDKRRYAKNESSIEKKKKKILFINRMNKKNISLCPQAFNETRKLVTLNKVPPYTPRGCKPKGFCNITPQKKMAFILNRITTMRTIKVTKQNVAH